MKKLFAFLSILTASMLAFGQSSDMTSESKTEIKPDIGVLEFRNYLLKPKTIERFRRLFNEQFVEPMNELGGYTAGQFRLKGDDDRFVWIRTYQNMRTRLDFLNSFYLDNPVWKKYRNEANSMMLNSDNVYLLRPLEKDGASEGIAWRQFGRENEVVIIDFYICNSTLDKVIELFKSDYLPFLKTSEVNNVTLWVSEMSENKFPRLPAFQDKNLLVSITVFKDEREAKSKLKIIDSPNAQLDLTMKELITARSRLVLYPTMR
jgi:hypothetical protein